LNLQAFFLSLLSLLFPLLPPDLWLTLALFSLFHLLLGALLPALTSALLRSVPSASATNLACAYSLALVLIFGQLPATMVTVSPYSFIGSVIASALIIVANASVSPEQDQKVHIIDSKEVKDVGHQEPLLLYSSQSASEGGAQIGT
jgi:hypothetical protein